MWSKRRCSTAESLFGNRCAKVQRFRLKPHLNAVAEAERINYHPIRAAAHYLRYRFGVIPQLRGMQRGEPSRGKRGIAALGGAQPVGLVVAQHEPAVAVQIKQVDDSLHKELFIAGLNVSEAGQIQHFLPEWLEAVARDYSHPSVIGWCPFNETWDYAGRAQDNSVLSTVYRVTKALDPTRPVIDTSGNYHVETDIFDVHDYEQNPELFRTYYDKIPEGIINDQIQRNAARRNRQKYDGRLPVFVSEYGGIGWMPEGKAGWGYGKGPATEEEFIARYRGLTDALLDNEYILGFCYTQLYDVEQEKNGLMTYDRKFKFDPAIFREINTRTAAIEKNDAEAPEKK